MSKLNLQEGSSNFPELSLEAYDGKLVVRHRKYPNKPFEFQVPQLRNDLLSAIPLARKTKKGFVAGPTVRIWPVFESDLVQITLLNVPGYGEITWFVLKHEWEAALAEKEPAGESIDVSPSQLRDKIDGVEE